MRYRSVANCKIKFQYVRMYLASLIHILTLSKSVKVMFPIYPYSHPCDTSH